MAAGSRLAPQLGRLHPSTEETHATGRAGGGGAHTRGAPRPYDLVAAVPSLVDTYACAACG